MKELSRYFPRKYSAVSTKDEGNQHENSNKSKKSLKSRRTLNRSFSILDSFFNERKLGERTRWPKCAFLLMAGGLLAITAAILAKVFNPYDTIFRWKLIFGEGGEIFSLWEKPPVDLYIKIYLFNITNAEDVIAGRDKMHIEEVGPYVYKEIFEHTEVSFYDNGTLSTRPRHPLVWQEHLSEGHREDDELMMINIALLSIAQVAAPKSYFIRLPVNLLIRQTNSQPIVKMTAKEFMFGYATELTTLGNTFLPNWISFEKVGLIDRMYDFEADFETFYTGETNSTMSGLYDSYKGSRNLPQWEGDHCSNIHLASDGIKFRSFLQPNETVKFFRKSTCRPLILAPTGEVIVKKGLTGHKYVFAENSLDNGYYDERNKCYCKKGSCQPRGLLDVSDCYYGFPISISYPHLMGADPKLLEDVSGSKPNETLHSSHFLLQPKSGLPLECSVKFQINMHMHDIRSIANVGKFSDKTYPMLWFEIVLNGLPESLNNRFDLYLNTLSYLDPIIFWAGLIGGILCLILAVTRAASKLPIFMSPSKDNGNNIYNKVNIKSGVYRPCEMKLMDVNEKYISTNNINEKMTEIDLKNTTNYMLNSLSHITDDESNDTDISHTSTASSQISQIDKLKADNKVSMNNSIYELKDDEKRQKWKIGEASSLMEDIGNSHFSPVNDTKPLSTV